MAIQRGLDLHQEQNQQQIVRDTRTIGKRVFDFFSNPQAVGFYCCAIIILAFLFSEVSDFLLIFLLIALWFCVTRKVALPFRMPQRANQKDYGDLNPGNMKPKMGKGIYFFGNDKKTKEELWFTNDDMRTHVLIFGSTGSGKTELLVSLAYNALIQASGFIYVDGKGDNSLYAKVFSMVRSMGREDDLLLINFMTGARDVFGPQEQRLSNTLNPFASGSSSMLAQLIISLMGGSSSSSDGDMWKGRAISFVEALMMVLVPMRDAGYILLDSNTIRQYFMLDRLETMVVDKLFIRDGQEAVSLKGFPPNVLEPLTMYVLNLPGYNKEKKGKQVSQVLEQHGFITMQLTRVFTTLADTYGHIMRTNLAEVDLQDVVLNRRILVVLLPALEKSTDELSNLGKVIIATLRAMMASGLGDGVIGDFKDIVESKPTNAETPYLCILDEYGYYAVEGFAVVPAQARSLGFSVVFAGQDYPAFQKASKEEAASIGANTNIKLCMKLEDPTETWDFFMKTAGEAYVSQVESFQVGQGSLFGNYQDGRGARLEKRSRIDLLDLKEQNPGEAHVFFRSKVVRMKSFYASPSPVKTIGLNSFLKVEAPLDSDVEAYIKQLETHAARSGQSIDWSEYSEKQDEKSELNELLQRLPSLDESLRAVDKMLLAVANSDVTQEVQSDDHVLGDLNLFGDKEMNVFSHMRLTDYLKANIITDDLNAFAEPLLDRVSTRATLEYIQRLCGRSGAQARNVANELVNDLQRSTYYPGDYGEIPSAAEMAELCNGAVKTVAMKKREASESTG
jgi:intracellular multiplication protein IcmO